MQIEVIKEGNALINRCENRPIIQAFKTAQSDAEKRFGFVDNRIDIVSQRIAKGRYVHQNYLRSIPDNEVVQGDFKDTAIEKLRTANRRDPEECDLREHTCGNAARIIYKVLQNGGDSAGTGVGVDSLIAAMSDADTRKDQVFIFFVDADIVGHFFTILQNGTRAVIMQGYLDKITIAQNIEEGGGAHNIWQSSLLRNDIKELIRLRDQIKNSYCFTDPDEDGLVALGNVHARLFGPGVDKGERLWIKMNIIRKKTDDLTWKASFAEGNGPKLKTTTNKSCFLTTACTQFFGLPDDCEELMVLRSFRDGYMKNQKNGNYLIDQYYQIAPGIVEGIYSLPIEIAEPVWKSVYHIICECVDSIKKGNQDFAFKTYKSSVLELKMKYSDKVLYQNLKK